MKKEYESKTFVTHDFGDWEKLLEDCKKWIKSGMFTPDVLIFSGGEFGLELKVFVESPQGQAPLPERNLPSKEGSEKVNLQGEVGGP